LQLYYLYQLIFFFFILAAGITETSTEKIIVAGIKVIAQ